MFGINPGEFAVLLLVALIVVGPERLPKYAQHLGRLVREGRRMAMGLREQVRGELGPEFDDVDWTKLDPRQYDPRKIIRDALSENLEDEPKPVNDGGPKAADTAKPAESAAEDTGVDLQKKEAAARPGSAASPMAAAAAGAAGAATAGAATAGAGPTSEDAAAAKAAAAKPAPSEPEDFLAARATPTPFGTDGEPAPEAPSVPAARTAGGAPVDLEAT